MKLTLPNGATYGIDNTGTRICTGSQMGRQNRIPTENNLPVKMFLQRLDFVDGAYDKGGAYWGSPANIYQARSVDVFAFGDSLHTIEVFVRADTREEAKRKVSELVPLAKFYR